MIWEGVVEVRLCRRPESPPQLPRATSAAAGGEATLKRCSLDDQHRRRRVTDGRKVDIGAEAKEPEDVLKGRKPSWAKLHRVDSLQLEAGRTTGSRAHGAKVGWVTTLFLAFQTIGVVYGDIGTSPLYVYSSTFLDGIKVIDDIYGVLSLILYTMILIPMIKYIFVVLLADNNGDGGTFALYSLISRYAKVSLIPNEQAEDAMLSNYKLETVSAQMKRAQWIKKKLEGSIVAKYILFLLTVLGTSMVIGDGILTPCISVLSAVSGIKQKAPSLSESTIAGISIAILVLLFSVQRFGTDKVGYAFAPIILLWFLLLGGIGLYNLIKYNVHVLHAFNPKYIIDYFKRNGKQGWVSLGGVVLCITGSEAMFADLGHFNVRAIQISFTTILFPSVTLTYLGQAAYLTKFPEHVADTFYKSIPGPLFWLTFVVAVSSAIIASQAMISAGFAIISQSQSLGCFPRVTIVHTSNKYEGQVFIPEINYSMMVACIVVTAAFRTTEKIGNAYGICVLGVFYISTNLLSLVMLLIWKTNILWIALFYIVYSSVELIYLSSVLSKFVQGGYLPVCFSLLLMLVMGVWHYAHAESYKFEIKNKVSPDYIRDLSLRKDIRRIPGVGLLYSELVQGIPPILPHFIDKIPSIHSVLVILSIKYLPISTVAMNERFLFRQIKPREYRMFRCVVRFGYKDAVQEPKEFERLLIEQLKDFIYHENFIPESGPMEKTSGLLEAASITSSIPDRSQRSGSVHIEEILQPKNPAHASSGSIQYITSRHSTPSSNGIISVPLLGTEDEVQFIQKEMENGVIYLLGETAVLAASDSSFIKKVLINYIYSFLRRNFRQGEKIMPIPHSRLLRVGMTYEI